MNLRKKSFGIPGLVALLFLHSFAIAQDYPDSLSRDDRTIVSSIAPYPAGLRASILNVSQYPQALVKLERIQARTSQSFQDLVSRYPRTEQEKFYQAVRYPEVINTLVTTRPGLEQARSLVNDLPEGSRQPIIDIYSDHFDDLAQINAIYQASQSSLDQIISAYDNPTQNDFHNVIENPDVMSLLTDNIDLTMSLGEAYKADPQSVTRQLDSMSSQLNDQNAKDLDAYKREVESNPRLQQEMKSAAGDFAQQYDQQNTSDTYVTNNYYGSSPYPYWFGYPYWYAGPMWYPAPFYYNTGFYYGPGGRLVVVGFPSYFYANWFFHRGYRRYPALYGRYNAYYNIHRANIVRANVYRGFRTTAHDHFRNAYRNDEWRNGRTRPVSTSHVRSAPNTTGSFNVQGNQLNSRSGGFNNRSFNHVNANKFHSTGWQGTRSSAGTRSFSGGTRSTGGMRPSGGMRSSGGTRGGAMHGGGGMRGRH